MPALPLFSKPLSRSLTPAFSFVATLATLALLSSCGVKDTGGNNPVSVPDPTDKVPTVLSPLVIEEIVPGNIDLLDERGEDPGWVEIANVADTAVPLGAWRLRGTDGDGPWSLPETSLLPGERILIFCSGLDRREIVPAGDSVSVFTQQGYAWSDTMNNPPGRSTFGPWEVPGTLRGTLSPENIPVLSATLTLGDHAGTDLEWAAVEVAMTMPNANLDVSGRDRLRLRATLPEGQVLLMGFCEVGQPCWQAETLRLVGTGRRLDIYDLSLSKLQTDLSQLASVYFTPAQGKFGTYHLTVAGLQFYRAPTRAHASFELQRKGGVLHLEDNTGRFIQSVTYPEMPATASWSRLPPTRNYAQRERPTPDAPNPTGMPAATLPEPVFLTATGYHAKPVLVRLKAVQGASVHCAKGGVTPSLSSPNARDGIQVDTTTALTCAAFDSEGRSGPLVSGLYLIGEKSKLPIVSIVVDSMAMFDSVTGLYMPGPKASKAMPYFGANFWEDTELPAHVEWHEPDGRRAFAAAAGVSIFGNWSRARPKRPLSVQFREKYGIRRINWPLFPQHPEFTRFKGFGLRNMGGDYGSGLSRDAFGSVLTEGRDLEYQMSRHVAVYLNGRYWGMYDMREKMDADYLDTRFGLAEDQIELIKNGGEVQVGKASGWNSLVDGLLTANLADSATFARTAILIDLDNMATYLATEIWAANTDWPANNTRSWRKLNPLSPWRMMLFDLDAGVALLREDANMFQFLGDSTVVDDYPNGPRSTVFFRRLSANPEWRARFVNRLCALLATNFEPTQAMKILDSMQTLHADEKYRDAVRWRLSRAEQNSADTRLRFWLNRRPGIVLSQMQAWYGLGDTVKVALEVETGSGAIEVEGYDLGQAYHGTHYAGLPMRIKARGEGKTFAGWSDGVTELERVVIPGDSGITLKARFGL